MYGNNTTLELYLESNFKEDDVKNIIEEVFGKDIKIRKSARAGIQNFKIPYVRWWGDVETTGITYDVGSHTEFYHLYKE